MNAEKCPHRCSRQHSIIVKTKGHFQVKSVSPNLLSRMGEGVFQVKFVSPNLLSVSKQGRDSVGETTPVSLDVRSLSNNSLLRCMQALIDRSIDPSIHHHHRPIVMTQESRYLLCSRKYGLPLFAGAWLGRDGSNPSDGEPERGTVVLAGGGGNQRSGVPNALLLADYNFKSTVLTDALETFPTGEEAPYRLAVHPAGEELVCSVGNDCRLFEVRRVDGGGNHPRVLPSERGVEVLRGIGEQNCLVLSPDGSRLAAGGDDGYLRVIEWGTWKVLLDKAEAHKSIKDLDFSLDGALVASTSDDSACRIWDVASGSCVASLPRVSGEGIGFVRFSRDGGRQLLYVAVRKRGMGFVSVFDASTWKEVNSRKLQEDPISAFSISRDGRYLAIGSSEGDISIAETNNLSVCQKLKRAHMIFVTSMEFSPSGRAILSVSADSSARVMPVEPGRSGSWQGSLLLLVIFFLSMLVVIVGEKLFIGLAPSVPHLSSLSL